MTARMSKAAVSALTSILFAFGVLSGHALASETGTTVRVMVKLRAPVAPESTLPSDAKQLQRLQIGDHQRAAVAALAGSRHRVLWQYTTTPYLAIETTPDGLRALQASPFVERVIADLEIEQHLAQSGPLVQGDIAHAVGITGAGQTIVIIDDGIES